MDHIETAILNCYGIREAEQNMVFAARLTQHGHTIQNMADLMDLYRQSYSQKTVENIAGLPHPTVQKFMVITVAVVGASRRFLAQITRHQNEVKYISSASIRTLPVVSDLMSSLANNPKIAPSNVRSESFSFLSTLTSTLWRLFCQSLS